MKKKMLIDATQAEETRVVLLSGDKLLDFDLESASKRQLKGNIYLAKVTRVEPSLQAAFVSYGGNRHGFLPFAEIHPDYYRIPIADRERLLAEQEDLRRQMRERRAAEEAADEAAEAAEEAARLAAATKSAEQPLATPESIEGEQPSAVVDVETATEVFTLNGPAAPAMAELDVLESPVSLSQPEFGESEMDPFESFDDENADMDDDEDEGDDEDEEDDGDDAETEPRPVELDADGNPIVREGDATGEEGEGRRGRGRDRFRRGGRNGGNRNGGGRYRRPGRREAALNSKLDELVDKTAADGGYDDDPDMQPLWKRIRRAYKIQEVIKRGQIMLIQVVKEERGNKGAAVTSYITMPGRYCVLMPNSPDSGGVSRKIANVRDRRRMRKVLHDMAIPDGMSVILRTAGVERENEDIIRDLTYQMKLWDQIRETTLKSTAPALIHEESSLIKRAIRDHYSSDVDEILVAGEDAYRCARDLMELTLPDQVERVKSYSDPVPLFVRHNVENQLDAIHSNTVRLRSGGYLVINPTEALVSIDVNSGRATRERHIEETALKTNLEAADEVARQLRLRDLGGLVVIDFIDMENRKYNAQVERRLRDALSQDRARIQVGRISNFGLLELSRQRLRPSLTETHFHTCPHCRGTGLVKTVEAQALAVLRAVEMVGIDGRAGEITVTVSIDIMMFILNNKRDNLTALEERYDLSVTFRTGDVSEYDEGYHLDISQSRRGERVDVAGATVDPDLSDEDDDTLAESKEPRDASSGDDSDGKGRSRRGRRGGRGRDRNRRDRDNGDVNTDGEQQANVSADDAAGSDESASETDTGETDGEGKGRARRGRRGGRGRDRAERGDRRHIDITEGGEDAPTPQHPKPELVAPVAIAPLPVTESAAPVVTGYNPTPADAAPRAPISSASYEVKTEADGEKKAGWWKRLVK